MLKVNRHMNACATQRLNTKGLLCYLCVLILRPSFFTIIWQLMDVVWLPFMLNNHFSPCSHVSLPWVRSAPRSPVLSCSQQQDGNGWKHGLERLARRSVRTLPAGSAIWRGNYSRAMAGERAVYWPFQHLQWPALTWCWAGLKRPFKNQPAIMTFHNWFVMLMYVQFMQHDNFYSMQMD